MKHFLCIFTLTVLCSSAWTADASGRKEKPEKPNKTKESSRIFYILGRQIGTSLKKLDGDLESAEMGTIDMAAFIKGLKSCFSDKEPLFSTEESNKIRQEFFKELRAKQQEIRAAKGKDNLKKSKDFLSNNSEKEGVITTESGLQYKVMKEGKGKKATATDKVTVHYKGTLLDGTEFDSSYKRGKPATFPVRGVIKGWQEALQLMNPGSKYKLFIPPDIGYGEKGSGRRIPPNAVLIFELEMLKVEKSTPKAKQVKPKIRRSIKPK